MGTRARRFFARFNRLELSASLVEASSGHPEFLGQLIDALAGPHALYGHTLKLPGISLSSLHCCFLSRRVCRSRVCQFKGSFHLNLEPYCKIYAVGGTHKERFASLRRPNALTMPTPLMRKLLWVSLGVA